MMQIEIIGSHEGDERKAAEMIKSVLQPLMGPSSRLVIVVGAKCYGSYVQDLDLLLLGTFGSGLNFLDEAGDKVKLTNLALIIELKSHANKGIVIEGQKVKVFYKHGWEDVTEKAFKQAKSLPEYLKNQGITPPWIESAVWLRNYTGVIPPSIPNLLKGSIVAKDFLNLISRVKPYKAGSDGNYIAFGYNDNVKRVLECIELFTRTIETTPLDRRRCEQTTKKLIDDQQYAQKLGTQMLIFRGQAGSGKTIHLLRVASDLYERGDRILFLTYNNALVADIKRLFVILHMEDSLNQGVSVDTAHGFFFDVLKAWGMLDSSPSEPWEEHYEKSKSELLELLAGQTPATLAFESVHSNHPRIFAWDHILIDEAQDWPENERDLLFTLFGAQELILADGLDQLQRRQERCDWTLVNCKKQVVPLKKTLRMGSILCDFVTAFSAEISGTWDQERNDQILSGKVTIIEGQYTKTIHEQIMQEHSATGNEPIDALFCAAPKSGPGKPLAMTLANFGCKVWDGTIKEIRKSFPTSTSEYRVVNYQSCRGLEGWTVVCTGLDTYYEQSYKSALNEIPGLLISLEEQARRKAAAKCLIPLTRAMNHIILQLDGEGYLYKVCRKLAQAYPDTVTWIRS